MAEKIAEKTTENLAPVNVSVRIPGDLHAFLDDLHWSERRKTADLLRDAITEFAVARGFKGDSAK